MPLDRSTQENPGTVPHITPPELLAAATLENLPMAVKYDEGKLRFDLIPPHSLFKLAQVYTIGAKKYSDRNWENGFPYGRVFAAMMRHAWRWWSGETADPVDGQHHLSSVAWCAFALMEYEYTHPELDDRSGATKDIYKERKDEDNPVGPGTNSQGKPLR